MVYTSCHDIYTLSPKILCWRVCTVYFTYGNMIDSKTKKPLFDSEAWKMSDNMLREILHGFYSDPPGFDMYNKILSRDRSILNNKYGMEIIECCRGTNRTEAYHKQIVTSVGIWHIGGINQTIC